MNYLPMSSTGHQREGGANKLKQVSGSIGGVGHLMTSVTPIPYSLYEMNDNNKTCVPLYRSTHYIETVSHGPSALC